MARPCRHRRASSAACDDSFDLSDLRADESARVTLHACPACGAHWIVRVVSGPHDPPHRVYPREERHPISERASVRVHAAAGTRSLDFPGLVETE
jgi:hypothetical protein